MKIKHSILAVALAIMISGCVSSQTVKDDYADSGDFLVTYVPTENENLTDDEAALRTSDFEGVAEDLNRFMKLPENIEIVFSECGQINAFYESETRRIFMCYELLDYFNSLFWEAAESEQHLIELNAGAVSFVLYHEIGHALADTMNLPITGREEDAADQLSVWVLLLSGEEGESAAINGANWFLSESQKVSDLLFWDEHSLDAQRFYNILCWVYGKDPEKYSYLTELGYLPEDRAAQCPAEYVKLYNSWYALLSPWLKDE